MINFQLDLIYYHGSDLNRIIEFLAFIFVALPYMLVKKIKKLLPTTDAYVNKLLRLAMFNFLRQY